MMTKCFLERPRLCAESIVASAESPHCRAPPGLSFIPLGEGLGLLLPLLHFEPDHMVCPIVLSFISRLRQVTAEE